MIDWICPNCRYSNEYELHKGDGDGDIIETDCVDCGEYFQFMIIFSAELKPIEELL